MTVQNLDQAWSVVADDERLYWSGVNAAGRMAFLSTSTQGGAVSQIQEWSSDPSDPRVLRAVDDQSLYFIRPVSAAKGIFAIPKGGGDTRTVAAKAHPLSFANKNIDETHIYWIDLSEPTSIKRAPKTDGGGIETVVSNEGGAITDMAVDHCNVYWPPSMIPRILVRRK